MIESYSNQFNRMRALRRTDLYSTFVLQGPLAHRLLLQASDELDACLFTIHCQTTQLTFHNSYCQTTQSTVVSTSEFSLHLEDRALVLTNIPHQVMMCFTLENGNFYQ